MNVTETRHHAAGDPAVAGRRRAVMASLVLALTAGAVWVLADLHWSSGFDGWKVAHLLVFTVLFALVAFGAVQAVLGFHWRGRRGGDPWRIEHTDEGAAEPLSTAAVTAIVLPVYNENPGRVFEGLRAIYESVEATGNLAAFEFFVLSDSTDPNRWIEEEAAWVALCGELNARGRLFYRRRKLNTNKKAGNLADFCRRWGRRYRYMVVLDADSVMTGESIVRLVRLMERNPGTGIIQTVPRLVRGETLFTRLQQFASRLYGPVFASGMASWQLGESNYWGHNAIIRTAPFIEHCSLPDLPGNEPFGGRILSHDYVEAALMRRAGWAVWLATDLGGSFEEAPANLIDYAKRDRRWLQGNLQHAWLLAARGLRGANRLHLLLGILAYLASPLWLGFVLLSVVVAARASGTMARPEDMAQALGLFGGTLVLLALPKVLAVLDLCRRPQDVAAFGGWLGVTGSVLLESVVFTLIAPVLMLFHTRFVVQVLTGRSVQWVAQRRGSDGAPDWREVILTHVGHTLCGLGLGGTAWWVSPMLLVWMSPLVAGLVLAIPLSLITAQASAGGVVRQWGLLCVPEETQPPAVLQGLDRRMAGLGGRDDTVLPQFKADVGILQAVLDPYVNAVHLSLLRERGGLEKPALLDRFGPMRERLLREGPNSLSRKEKLALLQDPQSLQEMHRELWSRPSTELAPWWREAMRQYNLVTPVPATALYG